MAASSSSSKAKSCVGFQDDRHPPSISRRTLPRIAVDALTFALKESCQCCLFAARGCLDMARFELSCDRHKSPYDRDCDRNLYYRRPPFAR